jgi:hypothetical protein
MGKISCIIASGVTLVSMEWSRCEIMQRNSTLITGKNENDNDKGKDNDKDKDKKKHPGTNLKNSKYHKG